MCFTLSVRKTICFVVAHVCSCYIQVVLCCSSHRCFPVASLSGCTRHVLFCLVSAAHAAANLHAMASCNVNQGSPLLKLCSIRSKVTKVLTRLQPQHPKPSHGKDRSGANILVVDTQRHYRRHADAQSSLSMSSLTSISVVTVDITGGTEPCGTTPRTRIGPYLLHVYLHISTV